MSSLKFQSVSGLRVILLSILVLFWCPSLWAVQDAMVIVDKALIYADQEMTSPLGFVKRGKKVQVGEIPRNKAQVYPIGVSGRVGYIKVSDVSTERESMETDRLVAERFLRTAAPVYKTKYVFGYYTFISQFSSPEVNDLQDKDSLRWDGIFLKGEILIDPKWDLQILANYMFADSGKEEFKVIEVGAGLAFRLVDTKRLLARIEAQFLAIPFSTYSYTTDFRLKSYGYTAGTALNLLYLFSERWGIEGYWGVYYTKLLEFEAPAPYNNVAPTFIGTRLGVGLNYQF